MCQRTEELFLSIEKRLQCIAASDNHADIGNIQRGIEKESLRVTPSGKLALTPHPQALGSTLTHPYITTDYSEALLEFITPPYNDVDTLLKHLTDSHHFTYQQLGEDALWSASMPCILGSDDDIPIAQYGSSNSGRMKSIYRAGLASRYGKRMQTIAGIHYNFSVSDHFWDCLRHQQQSTLPLTDFKTQGYFSLIRNFRRYFWLLLYLFGAAPAVCRTFIHQRAHSLVPVGEDKLSLHAPLGTSLRMGDLGYQSAAQESLVLNYNCLETYIKTLCQAITRPHPAYKKIGLRNAQGEYLQLNTGLLQIENEFYSVIRPKRTTNSGETALSALSNRGVEYIEVRCLDVNPYETIGINCSQIHFLDVFLLYCLLADSPLSDEREHRQIQDNQKDMVYRGRDIDLQLFDRGSKRNARQWGCELMKAMTPIAQLLNTANDTNCYTEALVQEQRKLVDAALTPSARILQDMHHKQVTFYHLAMELSQQHRHYFNHQSLNADTLASYRQLAEKSIAAQHALETTDQLEFETYLSRYYEQYHCCADTSRKILVE
jgi:glutamate--cysteine ligase